MTDTATPNQGRPPDTSHLPVQRRCSACSRYMVVTDATLRERLSVPDRPVRGGFVVICCPWCGGEGIWIHLEEAWHLLHGSRTA